MVRRERQQQQEKRKEGKVHAAGQIAAQRVMVLNESPSPSSGGLGFKSWGS